MQDLITFWHQHWDSIVHYAGVIIPWVVEVKLRLLGILLSWPAVTLYLGLLFMVMFRNPLARLIDRIKHLKGPWGLEAEPPPPEQKVVPLEEPQEPPTPEPPSPTDQRDSLAAKLETAETALDSYKQIVAGLTFRLHFERGLNAIFGSQLALLRALVNAPDGRLHFGALSIHFATHERLVAGFTAAGGPQPTIVSWTHWLEAMGFVKYDAPVMTVQLLPMGYNFVGYANEHYGPSGPWRNG